MSTTATEPATSSLVVAANLDLLRSVAVLFVVAFHLALYFGGPAADARLWPLGHFGVLMFFVHTSLVLMLSLERQSANRPGAPLFGTFLLRRLFRLAPLAFVVIGAIVILRLPVVHLRAGQFVGKPLAVDTVLSNLFFIQNLTHADSVEAPLWSLPYELQMYLLLPFLYLLVRRCTSGWMLVGAWVAAGCLAKGWLHVDQHSYFDFPIYVPCFLAGVFAYRMLQLRQQTLPFFLWPVLLGVCSLLYLRYHTDYAGWLCCLLIGVGAALCRELRSGAVARASHLVARYSYGVYLTHFPCIWVSFVALRSLPFSLQLAVCLIGMVILPVALYHLVEEPMIALGARLTRPSRKNSWALVRTGTAAPE